jgi:hypothetical protein
MATVDVNAKNADFGRSAKRGLDREAGQSFFMFRVGNPND